MTRKITKEGETRFDSYGRRDVLDEKSISSPPERNLWASVVFQAILNVNFRVRGWEEDLHFLGGGRAWEWVCDVLGLDYKYTSECAIRTALGPKMKFAKRV